MPLLLRSLCRSLCLCLLVFAVSCKGGTEPPPAKVTLGPKGRTLQDLEKGDKKSSDAKTLSEKAPEAKPPTPKPSLKISTERLQEFAEPTPAQEQLLKAGVQAMDAGDLEGSLRAFEVLMDEGPLSGVKTSGTIALADIYREQGKTAEALKLLELLYAEAPPTPEIAFVLGRAYKDEAKREEAILAFREALRLQPLLLHAHVEVGGLLQELGRGKESADAFLIYERALYKYANILEKPETHPKDKIRIAEAFSFVADDRAHSALLDALKDENRYVRIAVVDALGEVGNGASIERLKAFRGEVAGDGSLEAAVDQAIQKIQSTPEAGSDTHASPSFEKEAP